VSTLWRRVTASLFPPREADPLTTRLLDGNRASLRQALAKLREFDGAYWDGRDPEGYRYCHRVLASDVSICRANVHDLQQSCDWQTRPRFGRRPR
jgi:hypothetical protein